MKFTPIRRGVYWVVAGLILAGAIGACYAAVEMQSLKGDSPMYMKVTSQDGKYSVDVQDVPLKEVLRALRRESGVDFTIDDRMKGRVTTNLADESLEDVLKELTGSQAFVYEKVGDEFKMVSAALTTEDDPQTMPEPEPVYQTAAEADALRARGVLCNSDLSVETFLRPGRRAILLQNAIIDAKALINDGRNVDIPEEYRADSDTEYYIVEFNNPVGDPQRTMLAEAGATVSHYVPNYSFAVHCLPEKVADLKTLPGVLHVEPYHPYFKMSSDILRTLAGDPTPVSIARTDSGEYNIMTYRTSEDLESALKQAGIDVTRTVKTSGRQVLSVACKPEKLKQLIHMDEVQWIEPDLKRHPMNDLGVRRMRAPALKSLHPYLTGEGVLVAVTDTGIDFKNSSFAVDPSLPTSTGMNTRIAFYDHRASGTSDGIAGDTHGHGTHVSGSILGNGYFSESVIESPGSYGPYRSNQFAGVASEASLVMIEDFNSFTDEEQAQTAYNEGARLGNNSWGNSVHDYSTLSAIWDELVRDADPDTAGNQQYTAFFSAGNDGASENYDGSGGQHYSIGSPGNAKNVITVGALEQPRLANNVQGINYDIQVGSNTETRTAEPVLWTDSDWEAAFYSSRGPVSSTDTRLKPDVVMPGSYVLSAQSSETHPELVPSIWNNDYRYGNVDSGTNFAFMSGTSMACPLTTGAGALIFQWYTNQFGKEPSPALLKAMLVNGATLLNTRAYNLPRYGLVTNPVAQGWGMVDVERSVEGPRARPTDEVILIDQNESSPLSTGAHYSRQVVVNEGEGRLKVTLAWTDKPGTPGNAIQLVNNLNLVVRGPGGYVYQGNIFGSDGVNNLIYGSANYNYDIKNNVEVVNIGEDLYGTFTVEVWGQDVPNGPQDYALSIMKGIGEQRTQPARQVAVSMDDEGDPVAAFSAVPLGGSFEGNVETLSRQIYVQRWKGAPDAPGDVGTWRQYEDQWFGIKDSDQGNGVSYTLEKSVSPAVAVDGENIYVAWVEVPNFSVVSNYSIYFRAYDGNEWVEYGNSAHSGGLNESLDFDGTNAVVQVDGAGRPVVAWLQDTLSSGRRVYFYRWNGTSWEGSDGGANPTLVNTDGGVKYAANLSMTVDGAGRPVLAWTETTELDIKVRRLNGSSWSSLPDVGSPPLADEAHLCCGQDGNLFITWRQVASNPGSYLANQIYAARYSGGWQSVGGSASWPGVSMLPATGDQDPHYPRIGAGANGDIAVSWIGGVSNYNSLLCKKWLANAGTWISPMGAGEYPGVFLNSGKFTGLDMVVDHVGLPVLVASRDFSFGDDAYLNELRTFGLAGDRNPPSFAGLERAVGSTNANVFLYWTNAVDDLSEDIIYHVYRGSQTFPCGTIPTCTVDDVFSHEVAVITNVITYEDTGLTPGLTYCFGVRASDTNGLLETNMVIRSASPVELVGDSDGDCLSNLVEFAIGTDSCNPDTDGDGMWDGWEWFFSTNNPAHTASFSLNPLDNGIYNLATGGTGDVNQLPSADPDDDGVTSLEEYEWYVAYTNECLTWTTNLLSPDPSNPDTDADGMDDGWEIINNFNPVDPADALLDADGDGLTNIDEFVWGADPHSADSDSDGLTDGEEGNVHFTDPSLPDTDLDGLTDYDEINVYYSNPINADSSTNGVSDGDMYQLGYNAGDPTAVYDVLLYETFETASRDDWTHYAPNAVLPFDLWHLSTVDLASNSTDVVYMNDHTYDTSYRFANDPSGSNSNATYNFGPSLQAALSSPSVSAVGVTNLFVEWKEYYQTEPNADFVKLQARGGSSSNWVTIGEARSGKSGTSDPEQLTAARWVTRTADISTFGGINNVQVRFLFTANAQNNEFAGWFVDDVRIYGGCNISGWVRNDGGEPIEGATVWAMGRGGVPETTNGMKYYKSGKIFGQVTTANDGSYSISDLPAGRYYVKAFASGYMAEFFDGDLMSGVYGFGNGLYPGVKNLDQVTVARGWVDMTTLNSSETCQFELEPGRGRSFLAVSLFNTSAVTYEVYADGLETNLRTRIWDGVANTNYLYSDFPTYQTTVDMVTNYNHPDWLTNTVAPNMLGNIGAGEHYIMLPDLGTNIPLMKVKLREGEQLNVLVATNQANGFLDVCVETEEAISIWLDGKDTGLSTPQRMVVAAGDHHVMLVKTNGTRSIAPKFVTVPMGNLTRIDFTEEEVDGVFGGTKVNIVDLYGNAVSNIDVFINGAFYGAITGDTSTAYISDLYAGQHQLVIRRDGYLTPAIEEILIEAGVTNSTQIELYPADEDYDWVGDNTEVDGYTNIALYARNDDPDSDGLNNLLEFTQYRVHNVIMNVFNPDSDADQMLDGQEVGFDGYNDRLALSTLETNAVEQADHARVLFSGRYLAGEDDFGNAPLVAAIECDQVAPAVLNHLIDTNMPTKQPMLTIFEGLPPSSPAQAIDEGHNMGARVLADAMPNEVDTDGDGMWDGFEYMYRTNLEGDTIMSPIACGGMDDDTDHDGLSNIEEFLGTDGVANTNDSTNPLKSDTDGDGLPDGWEYFYGYDPNDPADAFFDEDGDSLVSLSEYYAGTNPQLADTDADGLPDNEEVLTYLTDPLDLDTDNDGLLDGREVWDKDLDGVRDGGFFPMWNHGDLDNDGYIDGPTDWDTDGDGMPDGFEVMDDFGVLRNDPRLDPYNPYDGDDDPDGDGLSNLEEYLVRDALFGNNKFNAIWDYSTDPFNADSDGDGMPDGWETLKGLHPMDPIPTGPHSYMIRYGSSLIPGGDIDGDGLANGREFAIRFYLDPNADSNTIDSLSTDPWNPDTDGDGLLDGEEDRSFRSHPIKQDTDGDGLYDGMIYATTGKMGEVESQVQPIRSFYRVVVVTNGPITWEEAERDAQVFITNYPGVEGHLAAIEEFHTNVVRFAAAPVDRDIFDYVYIAGDLTNIAIGGVNYNSRSTNEHEWISTHNDDEVYVTNGYEWSWSCGDTFHNGYLNFFDTPDDWWAFWTNTYMTNYLMLPVVNTNSRINYLALDTSSGVFIAATSTQLFDAYVIEWDVPMPYTNNYDRAMNDMWRLVWPSLEDLPHWESVEINTNSTQPLPRWGAGASYIPVVETKDPKDDDADPNGGKATMLMDNRKMVVIGGRDGVTRRNDIWEFLICSNMWTKSDSELDDILPGLTLGNSEFETLTFFGDADVGICKCRPGDPPLPADCTGTDFMEPKTRPWDGSRSYDWTYVFGGWDEGHAYQGGCWFYKSTDSRNGVWESRACEDYAQAHSETYRITVTVDGSDVVTNTTLNVLESVFDYIEKDGGEVVPVGVYTNSEEPEIGDNYVEYTTNYFFGLSALHFGELGGMGRCEEILEANLVFEFYTPPFSNMVLEIKGELAYGFEAQDYKGWSPSDYLNEGFRPTDRDAASWPFHTSVTNIMIPAGTAVFTQDVTKLVMEMIENSEVDWYGESAGFVIASTNTDPSVYALLKNDTSHLDVNYRPGYILDPYWTGPSSRTWIDGAGGCDTRKSGGIAYDRARERAVTFGGMNGEFVYGGTYEGEFTFKSSSFAPDNVTWEPMYSVVSPCARWGHSMVYDAVNERIIMFGGFDKNHKPLNDLWAYYGPHTVTSVETNMDGTNVVVSTNSTDIGANWVELTDFQNPERPQPRGGANMVYWGDYDYSRGIENYCIGGNHQKIVLFGGTDGENYFNDLWVYDPTYHCTCGETNMGRWILVNPEGQKSLYNQLNEEIIEGPGPRAFASMVWAQNGGMSPDIYGYGDYTEHTDPPSPCAIPCMYLFGGRTGPLPTGRDTDDDMVDDGLEYELGGPAAGRDPRLNAFINIHTNEKLPYVYKRIGPVPTLDFVSNRTAIANMEGLRNDDGGYAATYGLPYEAFGDEYQCTIWDEVFYNQGVNALDPLQSALWYHRYGVEDPFDSRDEWELGVPNDTAAGTNAAPPYAHSGRWCYGTDLDGLYPNDAYMELYSPWMNLVLPPTDSTDTNNPNSWVLVFYEWLDLADSNDVVTLDAVRPITTADIATRVSDLAKPDVSLISERNNAYNTTGSWRRVIVPLDSIANEPNIFLKFALQTDSNNVAGGWYIDDVAVIQASYLSGTLTNVGAGVPVALFGENSELPIDTTLTDENGFFQFGMLPLGNYYLGSGSSIFGDISLSNYTGSAGIETNVAPLEITNIDGGGTDPYEVTWPAVIGMQYRIEYVENLMDGWTPLAVVTADSNPMTYHDHQAGQAVRFYRVVPYAAP